MNHGSAVRDPASSTARTLGSSLLPWVIGVVGCLASVAGWQTLLRQEERAIEAQFLLDAGERELALQERFEDAIRALQSVRSLYDAAGEVSRDQFSTFVGSVLERHPYVQGIGWNRLVEHSEREAFEKRVRASGVASFRITERATQGLMKPAEQRDQYVVVEFVEPLEGNEAALGFDTMSEPNRLRALTQAGQTGELAITSRITLVQEREQSYGFLGFVPVFGEVGGSAGPEPGDLQGFVVGVFRVAAVVESALQAFDPLAIDLVVTDESAAADERGLFSSAASAEQEALMHSVSAGGPFQNSWSFELGAREWKIVFVATEAYLARLRTGTPLTGLLAGLVLTLVGTAYLVLVAGHAARVDRLVGLRTAELRDANRALENEVDRRARVETELSVHGDLLEDRVRERTGELEQTTLTLREAIKGRDTAEAALIENEERLKLTLEAVADGAWDWSVASGKIVFSDRWLGFLGYERADTEPTPRFWQGLVHPDDRPELRNQLSRHLRGDTPHFESENRVLSKEGEYLWSLVKGQVVARDPAGKTLRMVGTATDIGERKFVEERQLRVERQVQQAQKLESLGVLAGGIAHDFNNLLVVVLGGTDLALLELPPDSPAKEHLELVATAAARGAELIRQIHAYSGQTTFTVERIAPAVLVEDVGQLLRSSVSKKADLQFEFAEGLPEVEGDATQLRQVVMNLLVNASDALEGGIGQIEVSTYSVTIADEGGPGDYVGGVLAPGDYVCLEIADDGAGMDEEVSSKIFDPFFTTKKRGQGLGLAATLGIVRSHRGAIRVQTNPGRGTRISVLLPVAAPVEIPPALRVEAQGGDWQASGLALVVDDDPAVRKIAERMLRLMGMEVMTANDGLAGVEAFARQQDEIAVTVLDMSMPHMDGADAFREIRRLQPSARVLLSSGYSERDSVILLGDDEKAAFVQKPYLLEELREKLERVLTA